MPRGVKKKDAGGGGVKAAAVNKKAAGGGAKKSKLYSMPEKIAEGTVLTDLAKVQWRVGPSIGTGGFGEIYSACRFGEKNYDYVIKCEPHANGPLFVEMHFYMRNAKLEDLKRFQRERGLKSLGMPYMIGNGSEDINGQKHRFIVMPRYGSDVAKHFLANDRRLPEGTVYRLALQMLDVYEFVHDSGYVHADLKAANILLGYGKGGGAQAYLVDYGLASHYTTKEFKPDPKKMHNGTIEYTSRDAHQGVPTMRADLEILGYNLIEWLGIQLPWIRDKLLTMPAKVQKAKEEFMSDVSGNLKKIFSTVPVPIAEFMKYVAKMEHNEKPDYDKCRKIFAKALKDLNIKHSGDLDFKLKSSNNPVTTKTGTTKFKKTNAEVVALNTPDSSSEEICASDDESGDVVLVKKRQIKTKVSPPNKLKTTYQIPSPAGRKSPLKTAGKITSKLLPHTTSPKKESNKISTKASTNGSSPQKGTRVSPRSGETASSSNSTPKPNGHQHRRNTPISAKANINFSPVISLARSATSNAARAGNTIINDNLTPNTRSGKTYEFNFELDVSMDANVVVNVKRKKKPMAAEVTTADRRSSSRTPRTPNNSSDSTPTRRVKVRKVASGDGSANSPRTPAVFVRKTKRLA